MQNTPEQTLARCSALLEECLSTDEHLLGELDKARAEFGSTGDSEADQKRFREWFFYERNSDYYSEPPVSTYLNSLQENLPESDQPFVSGVLDRLFGIFEVVGSEGEQGTALHDLFSQRDYWLRENSQDEPAQAGDVLIGRLFPTGEGDFILSSASRRSFRDPALKEALRNDLARVKSKQAGSRLSQAEVEKLFQLPTESSVDVLSIEDLQSAWDELVGKDYPEFSFKEISTHFQSSKNSADVMRQILERLAFDSQVDLQQAQLLLLQLRNHFATNKQTESGEKTKILDERQQPCRCGSGAAYSDCCLSKDAVKAFEEGRARGENMDELFAKLEKAMGIDDDEDENEDVIPAESEISPLIEEYIWEREGIADALEIELVQHFGQFVEQKFSPPVSHLDKIDSRHLLKYLTVEFLESKYGKDSNNVKAVFLMLRNFCQWSDLEQGTELLGKLEPLEEKLSLDLPRIAELNRQLTKLNTSKSQAYYKIESKEKNHQFGLAELQDSETKKLSVEQKLLESQFRVGDLVAGIHSGASNAVEILTVYPAEAESFLRGD